MSESKLEGERKFVVLTMPSGLFCFKFMATKDMAIVLVGS